MIDTNKLGLLSDDELMETCNLDNSLDSTYDMTGSDDKKGAKAALAAGPAAAVFLPYAAPEAAAVAAV
jgi:hypothetical protein